MVTAHGTSERALAAHAGPRPDGRRGDLSARARGASGHQGARARRLSPGHHRPAQPRRGSRADRRPGRRSTSCWTTTTSRRSTRIHASASRPRRRSRSRGCGTWSSSFGSASPVRRPLHRHGLSTDQRPAECRPRPGASIDVVIVVGGANSNNTRELARTCGLCCPRVHHVQAAADLRPAWFRSSGCRRHHGWHVDA